jgi:hypothetical protein
MCVQTPAHPAAALGFLYAVLPRTLEAAPDVPIPELFGGSYGALDAAVQGAIGELRRGGVEPVFVFDGARAPAPPPLLLLVLILLLLLLLWLLLLVLLLLPLLPPPPMLLLLLLLLPSLCY